MELYNLAHSSIYNGLVLRTKLTWNLFATKSCFYEATLRRTWMDWKTGFHDPRGGSTCPRRVIGLLFFYTKWNSSYMRPKKGHLLISGVHLPHLNPRQSIHNAAQNYVTHWFKIKTIGQIHFIRDCTRKIIWHRWDLNPGPRDERLLAWALPSLHGFVSM